ncbi:MAG: hypothetical protein Q9204_005823 [Flavoplaca sp. TL-2023a]
MSDITTFINFTSEGRFTPAPSIPTITYINPAAGLQTFLLSKLMQIDTYYAIPMEVVDRATYESTSAANTRNYYYWSPSTHRMYELRNKGRVHIEKFALAEHISNDRWGDAQLLFDGGYNCTAAGNAGAAIVNEKPDGGIDFSCVSQLPMYLPRNTPCPPSTPVGGVCPFGYLN